MRWLSADVIFTLEGEPLKGGVVGVEADGTIAHVYAHAKVPAGISIEYYNGAMVPGFVNTHCHLELSHLVGKFERHKGLPDFLLQVMGSRGATAEEIEEAAAKADRAMARNGIVAVADISNTGITAGIKGQSAIYYHTLAEVIGLDPQRAGAAYKRGEDVVEAFKGQPANITPHAPYTASRELLEMIANGQDAGSIFSIHNQETAAENELYLQGGGAFTAFYDRIGQGLGYFTPTGKTALRSIMPVLPHKGRVLLVHNTFTTGEEVAEVAGRFGQAWFCLCPKANLYIEDRLPDVAAIMAHTTQITLGTDSLASNDALNIAAEMYCLQEQKGLGLAAMLPWATLNGAKLLGLGDSLGSIKTGKRPGLNLLRVIAAGNDFKLNGGEVTPLLQQ